MNILVLSWRDPKNPLAGGAEQVMHEHVKGWIKGGHSVTHLSSSFRNAPKNETLDGIEVIRRGSYFLTTHLFAFLWYLFSKHKKFDLIVDEFHGIPFFSPLYIRAPKLAILQEVAKEVWWLNPLPKPLNWIIGWIGFTFEPFLFLLYKNIPFMTGSQSAKDDLITLEIDADKITVVPHGVIVNAPKILPRKEKRNTIVFLGALTKDKGIEDAIKTFLALTKKGEYNFWVMGDGDESYVNHLKNLARKHGLGNKVQFFGRVSEKEKFDRLTKAHILINPSIREGWGLVNIEANAVGTPVVAYKSQGLIDSVKDGQSGILCSPNTPENLAENVHNLLRNKEQYKKYSRGAVAWSKEFSWDKSRKISLELIEKAASK